MSLEFEPEVSDAEPETTPSTAAEPETTPPTELETTPEVVVEDAWLGQLARAASKRRSAVDAGACWLMAAAVSAAIVLCCAQPPGQYLWLAAPLAMAGIGIAVPAASWARRRRWARTAMEKQDIRALGLLLMLLKADGLLAKSDIIRAISALLPRLSSTDELPLEAHKQMAYLVRFCADKSFVHRALEAIGRTRNTYPDVLFAVRTWSHRTGNDNAGLRNLASEILPQLMQITEAGQQHAVLLRPSMPGGEHAAMLLRAAEAAPQQIDPQQMLRPSDSNKE